MLAFIFAAALAQEPTVHFEYQPLVTELTPNVGPLPLRETGCNCTTTSVGANVVGPHTPDEVVGRMELQLQFRRGRLDLVSVANTSPGLQPYLPCIKHELAHHQWDIKRGKLGLAVVHVPEALDSDDSDDATDAQ